MVTVTAALVPPAPEQAKEKLVSPFKGPVLVEPLAASAPLQPPEAAHAVAPVEFQVNWLEAPASTIVDEAESDAVGTAGGELPAPVPPPQDASATEKPAIERQRINRNIPTRFIAFR